MAALTNSQQIAGSSSNAMIDLTFCFNALTVNPIFLQI
jgi:hypothetical protein